MRFPRIPGSHLSYCTNIHPAESWEETRGVLAADVLAVRDLLREDGADGRPPLLGKNESFAIGLRLSARAAAELLAGDHLARFRDWLEETTTYVFSINGFPFGDFHGRRVKEKVFQPDWTRPERVDYTKNLFRILAAVARPDTGASVSTLPGSHKSFHADDSAIRQNLLGVAAWLDALAEQSGHDFHLGLEPEPLGHFENLAETTAFFDRLRDEARDAGAVARRIGLNYDACHFALEYEEPRGSLDALRRAGVRLSKIHLSSALAFDPRDPAAVEAIRPFDEEVYFHQVLLRGGDGEITRFADLPDFLAARPVPDATEARVHFHIPLDAEPAAPLRSTRSHARETINWCAAHPDACRHFEIETYTWAVLPPDLRRPVTRQIAAEFDWVLGRS